MSETRLRLGETLIEAKILEPAQLQQALAIQKKRRLRLGTILLQEGFVTEPQLVQALSRQLSIPWVSLWHIDVPDELLDLVPANVAEEFFLVPIYIRSTKDGEKALYVAMNDPTDDAALRFVSAAAGMPVKPMIAGPSDIAEAIRVYYYGEEDQEKPIANSCPPRMSTIPPPSKQGSGDGRGAELSQPSPKPTDEDSGELSLSDAEIQFLPDESAEDQGGSQDETAEARDTQIEAERDRQAEALMDEENPDAAGAQGEDPGNGEEPRYPTRREAERYMWGIGRDAPKKGFSMTLLDGTTVSFGGASQKRAEDSYTKEDLLAGLRALAFDTPMDDLLPSDRWERYMAALLEVLFKKHLVLYDEFIESLKKE
jgi:type IV pilus assembly protein PilB